MTIRFDDIGNRLKAFRLGSGLTAEEIAKRIGTSRTALYRFEKGEVAKIETLEKLAELLDVSVPTLLGVGVEYVASAVSFFERLRQIEEASEHITVLAGPVSLLLASDAFDDTLEAVLIESIPDEMEDLGDDDLPEPLFLEKRLIKSGEQTFTFMVDERPARVGVDPYNKMIDRNPDDNLRSI